MYKITFPIPICFHSDKHISIPSGLARDILTQLKYEKNLRLICPTIPSQSVGKDYQIIDLDDYPGLSFRGLPWNNSSRSWLWHYWAVKKVLMEEARDASVWHCACTARLWDITTVGYEVGKRYAPGLQVYCLDSDPVSLLKGFGGWRSLTANFIDRQIKRRVSEADATIFVGIGVQQRYEQYCQRSLGTQAFWLKDEDLASTEEISRKYQNIATEKIRMILPVRLEAWKGADDVIEALIALSDRLPNWTLDIMGEGSYKSQLISLAAQYSDRIQFIDPVPYGSPFFEKLRSYHIVFVPTRGLEEQRVAYDAAASGCALIHSRTVTLENSLSGLEPRWKFEPGNVESLVNTIEQSVAERSRWLDAGLAGLNYMQGKTIDEMHRIRAEFIESVKKSIHTHASTAVPTTFYKASS